MKKFFETLLLQIPRTIRIITASLLLFLSCSALYGQRKTLHIGLVLREDFQLASIGSTKHHPETSTKIQQSIGNGFGIFSCQRRGDWGWNGSALLSSAKYFNNENINDTSLELASLKLTKVNLSAVYYPGGRSFFVEAGPQLVYRRYGTEYYTYDTTEKSFWPKTRLMFNVGAGTELIINNRTYGRISAGLRFNPAPNKVVYDAAINQIWISMSVGLFNLNTGRKKHHY